MTGLKEDDDFIILKSHIIYNYLCLSATYICLVLLIYQEPELMYPFHGPQSQRFVKKYKRSHLRRGEKGDLRRGWTERRGLWVYRHLGHLIAPRPNVSEPHGGRGLLMARCRCPAGVKGRRGHSPGERGRLALREPPGKSPAQVPSPQVFPAHTVSEELRELLGNAAQGKLRGSLGAREGFRFPGQVPRDPVKLL